MPNPSAPNTPVMITAAFAGAASQNPENSTSADNESFEDMLPGTDPIAISVLAEIKDSDGTDAGNVTLQHTYGNEYAGIWNAGSIPGIYKVNLKATASKASKTFNDTMQIEIASDANAAINNASGN